MMVSERRCGDLVSDLFSHHRDTTLARVAPLADRLRPRNLDDFVGQESILGVGRLLRRAITADTGLRLWHSL